MAKETAEGPEEILLARSSLSAMITMDSFPPKLKGISFSLKCRWVKPSLQTSRVFVNLRFINRAFPIYKSQICDLKLREIYHKKCKLNRKGT